MAIRLSASNPSDALVPTFSKWRKENEITVPAEYKIVKVLWNGNFKSITFFTEHFRYSVKLDTSELFDKQCKALISQMGKYCYAVVKVSPDSHEVFIDKVSQSSSDFMQFEWFDWGMLLKKSS